MVVVGLGIMAAGDQSARSGLGHKLIGKDTMKSYHCGEENLLLAKISSADPLLAETNGRDWVSWFGG